MNLRQHGYAEDYTASEKVDLYTLVFDITRTGRFEDFNLEKICNTLSRFPMFSKMTISVQDLEKLTGKMMNSLCVNF